MADRGRNKLPYFMRKKKHEDEAEDKKKTHAEPDGDEDEQGKEPSKSPAGGPPRIGGKKYTLKTVAVEDTGESGDKKPLTAEARHRAKVETYKGKIAGRRKHPNLDSFVSVARKIFKTNHAGHKGILAHVHGKYKKKAEEKQ